MKVDFQRLTWEDYPSRETPINAENLNRLEEGVGGLYSDLSDTMEDLAELDDFAHNSMPEYVSDWLDEHVTPAGSAVIVDDTLSIEGAAADAKATGDAIDDINGTILPVYKYNSENDYAPPDWVVYDEKIYECLEATTGTFDSTKWHRVRYPYYICDLKKCIAEEYANSVSVSITYYPGEYCIYAGSLWKCINQTNNHPLYSAPNTNWRKVNVMSELNSVEDELKGALSAVEEVLGSVAVIDSDDKYLVTFSVNSNNHMVATFTLAS